MPATTSVGTCAQKSIGRIPSKSGTENRAGAPLWLCGRLECSRGG